MYISNFHHTGDFDLLPREPDSHEAVLVEEVESHVTDFAT